jgi:hypothetical protein
MNWSECIMMAIIFISLASINIGKWPWQRDIHHSDKDEDEKEN